MLRSNPRFELMLLIALTAIVTIVFAFTPLDMDAARLFYRPDGADHWPFAKQWPWSVLYELSRYITASLLLCGLLWLLFGLLRGHASWRLNGTFLILAVLIGPGLLINMVFKDHWDRPRPRDVVQLGGTLAYTPAPLRGTAGESFPCGHCSVGFLYASGWWLWRRRRPRLARASLALGLTVGFALGLGRMAAGGHFLSDVFWSALLALGLAHVLYYYILRIPALEAMQRSTAELALPARRLLTVLSLLGAALVLSALFLTPHGGRLSTQIDLSRLSPAPRVLMVSAPRANIDIVVGDSVQPQMLVDGELHGFGLPTSRLHASTQFQAEPLPTLTYRIEEQGWITDLSAAATIRLPPGALERIVVSLQSGNIRVTDATRARVLSGGALQLDLHTAAGHVQLPND